MLPSLLQKFLALSALGLLFAFVLTACDSNDSGEDLAINGESTFSISGGRTATTTGGALFFTGADVTTQPESGVGFAFYRIAAGDTTFVVLARDGSNTLPDEGAYTIDSTGTAFYGFYSHASASALYLGSPEAGTLTLDRIDAERADGTFTFTGQGFDGTFVSAPQAITVDGSFRARRATEAQINQLIEDLGLTDDDEPAALLRHLVRTP